jgi:quinolinate synthase
VGERGGTVCTSSNALGDAEVGVRAGRQGAFLPDQHSAETRRTTRLGIPLDEMVVWDPHDVFRRPRSWTLPRRAKMLLWKGPLLGARALHGGADRERS